MQKSIYRKITGALAVVTMMTLFSCSEDLMTTGNVSEVDSDAITFSIMTENTASGTRSEISDGSMVNRLYYAIYKEVKRGEEIQYELDPYYHPDGKLYKEYEYDPFADKNYVVKLLPDPSAPEGQKYRMLCWVQETHPVVKDKQTVYESYYYDITEFPKVRVNYENSYNNDESRDAFYACKNFTSDQKGKVMTVTLTRPFAQINVGTSGWDYEGMSVIEPDPMKIKYSQVKVTGVANTLDILHNKATLELDDPSAPNQLSVDYLYEVIPAYRHLEKGDLKDLEGVYADDSANVEEDPDKEVEEKKGVYTVTNTDEEFLKVTFSEDQRPQRPNGAPDWDSFDKNKDGFADYISWEEYKGKCVDSETHEELIYNIYTETYKYLSMCYILVPFDLDGKDNNVSADGTTVEFKFECALADESGTVTPDDFLFRDNNTVIELNNVPVRKNYRTNIIAANGTGFFMNANELNVAIQEETFADYYRRLGATDSEWDQKGPDDDPDRTGDSLNGDYNWGDDDIDSEAGKTPLVLPSLTGFKLKWIDADDSEHWDTWGNVSAKYIDLIKFWDDDVKISFDLKTGLNRYQDVSKYIDESKLKFTYSIGGEVIPVDDEAIEINGDSGVATIRMSRLREIIQSGKVSPQTIPLIEYENLYDDYDDDPAKAYRNPNSANPTPNVITRNDCYLRYYPIEFRISTDFGASNSKFRPEDLVVTLRVYSSYKFTFSSTSTDLGGSLWDELIASGTKETKDDPSANFGNNYGQLNQYYIDNGKSVNTSLYKMVAKSRDKVAGGNGRLFALPDNEFGDHLKFRGASNYSNNEGHYLVLKNLTEKCKISLKVGRDIGQDNNNNNGDIFDRNINIDLGNNQYLLLGSWAGIPNPWNASNNYRLAGNSNQTRRYINPETKIMSGNSQEINEKTDVTLVSLTAGYCIYWVIISDAD